jgi:hypothetical protein
MVPAAVLLGRDGLWKIGYFGLAAVLPLTAGQMREHHHRRLQTQHGTESSSLRTLAPEAVFGSEDSAISPQADIWSLGYMLATLLITAYRGGTILEGRTGTADTLILVSPDMLMQPLPARLWLLLHWMLSSEPTQRPKIGEVCALLSNLEMVVPREMMAKLPAAAQFHCGSSALSASRQLSAHRIVSAQPGIATAGQLQSAASLQQLRELVADPSEIDTICQNCGISLDWIPAASTLEGGHDDAPDVVRHGEGVDLSSVPQLVPVDPGQRLECWSPQSSVCPLSDCSTSADSSAFFDSSGSFACSDCEELPPLLMDVGAISGDDWRSDHDGDVPITTKKDK